MGRRVGTEQQVPPPGTWDSSRALKLGLELRARPARGESASLCPGAKHMEGQTRCLAKRKYGNERPRREGESEGFGQGEDLGMRDQGPSRTQGGWGQSGRCHRGVDKVCGVAMEWGPTD